MRTKPCLTLDDANRVIAAAKAEAMKNMSVCSRRTCQRDN